MKDNEEIYILEATSYHWAKDEHISLLERKEWIGYGDIGKSKLEEIMRQISNLWKEVYIDNRDDTQVVINLYTTVKSNGIIFRNDVCDYKIISGENNII